MTNQEDFRCISHINYRSVCFKVRMPSQSEPRRTRSRSVGCAFRLHDTPGHRDKHNSYYHDMRVKSQSETELSGNRKCERLKSTGTEGKSGNKQEKETNKKRSFYGVIPFKNIPYTLRISTYRPFECPMPPCKTLVCPSLLLQHLEACHKELPSTPLGLASGNASVSSFDVYPRLITLLPQSPSPVHMLKVDDHRHPPFGILVNMCWLNNPLSNSDTVQPLGSSCRWLAVWVSCHYLLPVWFRIQFVSYSTHSSYLTFVCRAHEIKVKPTLENVAKGSGVMIVNETSLRQYYTNENALYVEVTTYLANSGRKCRTQQSSIL